jgi:hypothetical protein
MMVAVFFVHLASPDAAIAVSQALDSGSPRSA